MPPTTNNQEENNHLSPPVDDASGKFIVADILSPKTFGVRAVAARKTPAPKRAQPTKPLEARPRMNMDMKGAEPGNQRALDEWFQKERKARTERASDPLRAAPSRSPRASRLVTVFLSIFAILLAGGYGASYLFSRMHVSVLLKSASVDMDEELRIRIDPKASAGIAGEIIELSREQEMIFSASGTDDVRAHAKGAITIYNAQDSNPQVLVARTRFEAPDGKIYRIREAVTVPGANFDNGALVPSSVDATVYADQPGEEYNQGLTDFTIPGFQGSPRFTGFYARSKTPMEGGHIGTATVVTQQDIDSARESLEQVLRQGMRDELAASVPDGFRLLEGAFEITTDTREFTAEVGDVTREFTGSLSMQARAIVFRDADAVRELAMRAELDPATVSIANWDEISLEAIRRTIEQGEMIVHARGTADFVWNLDAGELTMRILAQPSLDALSGVFKEYGAIDRAKVRFSPSWIRTIPRDAERIIIETGA